MRDEFDAVVVGAGPNGLTAGAVLARSGRRVLVLEAADTIGGGARTDEAFGSGIYRDICSAVHPTGFVSPAFDELGLEQQGLQWINPKIAVAHVGADEVVAVHRGGGEAQAEFGDDARRWRQLVTPTNDPATLAADVFALPRISRLSADLARFGALAALPVDLANRAFRTERAAMTFAGIAAHSARALTAPGSAAAGLLLGMLTVSGWPIAAGGSQAISDALAAIITAGGGRIETGIEVAELGQLPTGCDVLLDTSPRVVQRLYGDQLGRRYARALRRFTYGAASCKVDFRLSEPIPWTHRPDILGATATFHLADSVAQIRTAEADVAAGRVPERPWVLGGEPTRIDRSRAPSGTHLAWAYCHVPTGSSADVSAAITNEIERRAPGFTDTIVDTIVTTGTDFAAHNANYIGGDINCGAASLRQLLARPIATSTPQFTGLDGVYLCSSATAPGGGVHGMSGYRAARAILAC